MPISISFQNTHKKNKEVKIKLEDEVRILSYLKNTKLGIKVIIF